MPRWPVVVTDDRLGIGQWQWAGGGSSRERAVCRERLWSGCNLALERASLKDRDGINVVGKWPRVGRRAELSEKNRCTTTPVRGGGCFLRVFREWISGFHDRLRTRPSAGHWYHPGPLTRPFQGLSCIHFTTSPDTPLSLYYAHCHWPVPSLSSLTTTGHLGNRHLYKPRSFRRSAYSSLMMETVRTSETSVDNHFTRQYNPEDSSEQKFKLISRLFIYF
jgi:hypothetical protein